MLIVQDGLRHSAQAFRIRLGAHSAGYSNESCSSLVAASTSLIDSKKKGESNVSNKLGCRRLQLS